MSRLKRVREASPGVSEKKSKYEESDSDEGFSGMERPSLLGKLRAILDEYPDSGQILKELIQNAEDADAREVTILLDSRKIPEPKDLLPEEGHLKALKAPALCVSNDAEFSKEDWQGIKQIQKSVKVNKPLKVGRFGLGFKSVFHITDFPCIISGDSLLVINPTEREERRVCYKQKLKHLSKKAKKTLLNVLKGNVGFKEKYLEKGYFRGTIFWFPLRSPVTKSCVSKTEYSDQKVHDLFQAFRAEASEILLFLKSVDCIELQRRKKDTVKTIFKVNAKHDKPQQNEEFMSKVKDQRGKVAVSSFHAKNYVTVQQEDTGQIKTRRWLLVSFYKGGEVSEELSSLCSDGSLSYCPYVGLAVALDSVDTVQGQVFCFLPLPMEKQSPTGLKVHINGFFALSQNRRHVKWPSADQNQNLSQMDKALQWNQCLLAEVFPEGYCMMIDEVISFCETEGNSYDLVQTVYKLLPNVSEISVHWRPLITNMYSMLAHSNNKIFYTPNNNGRWIQASEGKFLDPTFSRTLKQTLEKVYTDYNRNVVQIQTHIYEVFQSQTDIDTVTPQKLSTLLLSSQKYERLKQAQKLTILNYLLTVKTEELSSTLKYLKLLPVASGEFAEFGTANPVSICEDETDINLYPGMEEYFVCPKVESGLRDRLTELASGGILGLKKYLPEHFIALLEKCMDLHFQGTETLLSGKLTQKWLEKVWKYIGKCNIDLSKLEDMPLIPQTDTKSKVMLIKLNVLIIVRYVPKMTPLPEEVCSALEKLGAVVVSTVPSYIQNIEGILGTVIHYPTAEGVSELLGEIPEAEAVEIAASFNDYANDDEKYALINILDNHHHNLNLSAQSVLKKLKLFASSNDTNLKTSLDELRKMAPQDFFPMAYPMKLLVPKSKMATELARTLDASCLSLQEVVQETLKTVVEKKQKIYTQNDVQKFMEFLIMDHPRMLEKPEVLHHAKQVRFLSTRMNTGKYRASELFDPCDHKLKNLFLEEEHFPIDSYVKGDKIKNILLSLGLKLKDEVTEEDLCVTAKLIGCLYENKYENIRKKAEAFHAFLDIKYHIIDRTKFQQFTKSIKCIPCIVSKPESYPKSLVLYNESKSLCLDSAQNSYPEDHLKLVGSVASVAEQMPARVKELLGLGKQPPVSLVLDHLQNISESYQSKDHSSFMFLLDAVYDFLSEITSFEADDQTRISEMNSVWTGISSGFKRPCCVYLCSKELYLSPYRIELPDEQKMHTELFQWMGCHKEQNSQMLVVVLQEVKAFHDNLIAKNILDMEATKRDLKIVTGITLCLSNISPRPKDILLPVHTDTNQLLLLPLLECTYWNADWLKDQTELDDENYEDDPEKLHYVHEDISKHTAMKLGVQSLTDRVLADTDSLDMNFGQTEPLTRRLKNLLKDYSDGFSVPKEILQNADDAGAKVVKFLYDERQNKEARTCLMHEGMTSLQGPALWAFNDATFSEDDFKNITKLSGATKECDMTKVGRFGLGFNAVYNLTDVPSFISGNTVVIFDPHQTFLGKCGLKADLSSVQNKNMLRKMKGQFMPFEGIFGCSIGSAGSSCPGTLFRFPLRTQDQAKVSDISSLSYDADEMKKFIQTFAKGAGDLLLFAQNVTSVEFYYLQDNRKKGMNPTLIFSIAKEVTSKTIQSSNNTITTSSLKDSILNYANSLVETKNTCIVEKTTIAVVTNKGKFLEKSSEHMSWNITWGFGEEASDQFAKRQKLKGLLSLAAVAVPLISNNKHHHIASLTQCNEGFHKKGHLFCFLPLPIETPLPVHINASFALTPNRKYLCSSSEDDKTISDEATWNEALASDAIPLAYVNAIEKLQGIKDTDHDSYYMLWPNYNCKEGLSNRVLLSFYKMILNMPKKVFFEHETRKRICFEVCTLLDPVIRFHTNVAIGRLAFRSFVHFSKGCRIIDIPHMIIKSIRNSGQTAVLDKHITTEECFFKTMFLPNICDSFWKGQESDRDKLTMHLLAKEGLREMLRSKVCIPTKPKGKLKKPDDLVHPDGKAAVLYDDNDELFPLDSFEPLFSVLCELGMKKDFLPSESIIERCKTVAMFHEAEKGRNRSLEIINYLSQATESKSRNGTKRQRCGYRYEDYTDLKHQLMTIPFLPVMLKPKPWPFIWAGTQKPFCLSSEVYFEEAKHLVSSKKCILSHDDESNSRELLKWLGVKGKSEVDLDTVLQQLHVVSGVQFESEFEIVFSQLYAYLDEKCSVQYEDIQKTIGDSSVLIIGNRIVSANKIAFRLNFELSPHLYKVDKLLAQYPQFLRTVGVREYFDCSDGLAVLKNISKSKKLSVHEAECFGRVTSFINELESTETLPDDDIRLIGTDLHLYRPSDLCIKDCEWLPDNSNKFLHQLVNESVARRLGVKTNREADLALHNIPFCTPFGQKEKLTTRLKRILEGYPLDSSVMKELLQNADDAKASKLIFIKDFRSHQGEKLFSKEWSELQGPALCVYNDSYFRQEDFEGIQRLGEGSKSEDPVQTGQYGIGFNAVYHLTDAPSFLTVGPETKETLCVLDPACQYVPGASEKYPGGMFQNLHEVKRNYPDVFPCYLQKQLKITQKGTIFRFPLRKKTSEICKGKVTEDDINKIIEMFQNDMVESLIFLQNVRMISIASIDSRGRLLTEFEVSMDISQTNMDKFNFFQNCLKEQAHKKQGETNAVKECNPSEVKIVADMWDSRMNKKQKWLVIHRIGYSPDAELPSDLQRNQDKIGLLPRGGVAVPLVGDMMELDHVEAKAFCILPLPVKTGLPMHVNGHFALDYETRRNLWNGSDYRTQWNDLIAKQVITPAYLSALMYIRDKIPQTLQQKHFKQSMDWYHSLFPKIEDASDNFWKSLMQYIYEIIFENGWKLFSVLTPEGTLKWVSLNCDSGYPGSFNTIYQFVSSEGAAIERSEVTLKRTLKDIGMKVLETPLRILHNLEKAGLGDKVSRVTPASVIQFLRSHVNNDGDGCHIGDLPKALASTNIKCLENLKVLIQFCQRGDLFELGGLPLALNNENTLRLFNCNEPLVVTAYSDLIAGSAHQVLHHNLYYLFASLKSSCLKRMDIVTFASLLSHTLDPQVYMTGTPVTSEFSLHWFTRLWCYLTEETKYKTTEQARNLILQHLGQWSLIPSRLIRRCGVHYEKLFPLKEGNKILNFYHIQSQRLSKELQQLPIPSLWFGDSVKETEQIYNHVVSHFVADEQRPERILIALASSCLKGQVRDSDVILQYLSDNLHGMNETIGEYNLRLYLRKLPIFRTLDNSLVSVDSCHHVYSMVEHSKIPAEGMKLISEQSQTVILRVTETSRCLLSILQLVSTNPTKLYLDIVLPHFDAMVFQERYIHLEYIRDKLLSNENESEWSLKEKLKSLEFIQTEDGQFLPASSFYDKDNEIFQIMCKSSNFPPPPFHKRKWKKFLKIAGLQCKVTTDKFVTFAEEIEKSGKIKITTKVKEQSDVLVSYLSNNCFNLEPELVQKIRSIKFILPFNLQEERGEEGKHLVNIHAQPKYQLVSFCESVSPDHALLIWSTVPIVTKAAAEFLHNSSMQKLLEINDMPSHSCVIKHIQNVSTSISNMQLTETSEDSTSPSITCVVKDVMTSIYEYLLKTDVTEETKAELKDYGTVYLPERGSMMKAEEVVINLLPEDEIKDYIEKAPNYFGQFFPVFEKLGASDRLSINTCLKVLEKLHCKTSGLKLDPNERQVLEKSLKLFLRCLDKEQGDWQVQCLYLPNEQCILKEASSLIILDDMSLKARTRSQSLEYLMDFEACIPDFPKGGLKKHLELIPEKFRPSLLSTVVKESLSDESRQAANEGKLTRQFKKLLSGEMISALVRLVHHVHCDENNDKVVLSGSEIEECMQAVRIVEVPNLYTVLQFKGNEIAESTDQKDNFLDISAESKKGTLYLSADMGEDSVAHTSSVLEFAKLINIYLNDCLQDKISVIEKMLQAKPEHLQQLLDGLKIKSSDFVSLGSQKSIYPPLGTFVEREFHWMLENSFTILEVGEYVAVEVFDPYDTMEDDEGDTDPVYIYAKVKEVFESDCVVSAVLKRYLLEVEEDRTEVIEATRIYKFCRKRSQETRLAETFEDQTDASHESGSHDLEAILAGIRKTLKEAWINFKEQDRNRVRKRLYLKWHPDKNPGREDMCNEICKMIQFYIEKLEQDKDIDDIKPQTQKSPYWKRRKSDPWYERMNRRSKCNKSRYESYQERHRGTSSSSSFGTSSSETFTSHPQPQPQPQEAKRWLQQAQADLAAAKEALRFPRFNNWTCFKCQQAAEKSIKALWYNRDSRRADRLREHNLTVLAMGLGNTELNNLAVELQRVIVDFNRLRYPDRLAFPRIPADQYTHDEAVRAVDHANKIVNLAASQIS